ncbi:XRE family transcriptional regulator [Herbaspirillum huttiense]|nr:XRE family transcriptional regulator [Herbaspirillum huttiense]
MTEHVMQLEDKNSEKQLAREVGGIIALRRKAKGWTQAQLAEQMGIEKETVSRLETGHISPTLGRLEQIAQLLGCDITDLLKITAPDMGDQALSLLNRMSEFSDSQQTMLMNLFYTVTTALNRLDAKERTIVEKFLREVIGSTEK